MRPGLSGDSDPAAHNARRLLEEQIAQRDSELEQISNLDEAKLDSGALEPLHIVARLTAR
jgi:hypothetical protein